MCSFIGLTENNYSMRTRDYRIKTHSRSLNDQLADLRHEIRVVTTVLILAAFFLGAGTAAAILFILR